MKLKNIKIVLFDIDGTLLDTTELIYSCYEHTIKKHNLYLKTRKEISVIFGKPLEACYKILFPDNDIAALSETHLSFQEKHLNLTKPFLNVKKTLSDLKKAEFIIVAITTRSKRTSIKSLEFNNIYKFFDFVISREDVINPKPHQESILKALSYFKINPNNAVMVGDTRIDVETGRNAKTKTIGVTYGPLGDAVKEVNPDAVLTDISKLLSVIEH